MRCLAALLLLAAGCAAPAPTPESAKPIEVQESEDLDEEIPPGHGSCCRDNRCKYASYPGRREWTQGCRDQGAKNGQWCPGACMLDVDALPPECVCRTN